MPTTIITVGDVADLNTAIKTINGATSGSYEIDFSSDILETTAVDAIDLHSGVTLTINGEGGTLDGATQ